MSLLADLLSKVKYKSASTGEGHKANVPPDLKRVVSSSTEKEATKKRVLILSALVIFAILVGVGAVYLMDLYIRPSAKIVRSQNAEVRTQTSEDRNQKELPLPPHVTQEKKVETNDKTSETPELKDAKPKPAKENSKQKPEQKKMPEPKTEEKKIAEEQMPEPKTEPKIENSQKDVERKPVMAREPLSKPQDSQKDVYLYTARTYESKKDYHHALVNYKKALEIDTNNYVIMNNISSVLIHMNSFEEAITYAKNALAIKRDYVPSLINIGIAYIQLDNSSEGEAYLSRALSIEPLNKYALLNLGLLYEKKGDNEKAFVYFSKLLEIGNIQGYLGAARIAEKQGKKSDAIRIYREILSMNNIDTKTRKLVNDRLMQLGQ